LCSSWNTADAKVQFAEPKITSPSPTQDDQSLVHDALVLPDFDLDPAHVHAVDLLGIVNALGVPVFVGLGDEANRNAAGDRAGHRIRHPVPR
jgi:hypothetical protein